MNKITYQHEVLGTKLNNEKKTRIDLLRAKREEECFRVINRGKLWYDKLSVEQYCELRDWYTAWLNVTETLFIPKEPEWINKPLVEEEIL